MHSFNRVKNVLFDRRAAVPSVILTALTGAFQSSFDNRLYSAAGNLFDLQVSFSPELFGASISLWRDHGTKLFLSYLQTDMFFCLCLALTLLSVTGMMWTHLQSLYEDTSPSSLVSAMVRVLFLFPFAVFLAGISADLLFYSAVKNPAIAHSVIPAASAFAVIKYASLALSAAGVMVLLALRRRRMKSR